VQTDPRRERDDVTKIAVSLHYTCPHKDVTSFSYLDTTKLSLPLVPGNDGRRSRASGLTGHLIPAVSYQRQLLGQDPDCQRAHCMESKSDIRHKFKQRNNSPCAERCVPRGQQ
jgi:hypothetical protein